MSFFRNQGDPKPGTSQCVQNKVDVTCENLAQKVQICYADDPCLKCNETPTANCSRCGCYVCGGKDAEEKQLFCEHCQFSTHIWCLDPPLQNIPDGDWFCAGCLKFSENLKVTCYTNTVEAALYDWYKLITVTDW